MKKQSFQLFVCIQLIFFGLVGSAASLFDSEENGRYLIASQELRLLASRDPSKQIDLQNAGLRIYRSKINTNVYSIIVEDRLDTKVELPGNLFWAFGNGFYFTTFNKAWSDFMSNHSTVYLEKLSVSSFSAREILDQQIGLQTAKNSLLEQLRSEFPEVESVLDIDFKHTPTNLDVTLNIKDLKGSTNESKTKFPFSIYDPRIQKSLLAAKVDTGMDFDDPPISHPQGLLLYHFKDSNFLSKVLDSDVFRNLMKEIFVNLNDVKVVGSDLHFTFANSSALDFPIKNFQVQIEHAALIVLKKSQHSGSFF